MKNMLIILLSFIALFSDAKPIPTIDLFQPAAMSQVQFSPDDKYISALIVENNQKYLSLTNIKTKEYQHLAMFDISERLNHYVWIDKSTIYVNFNRKGTTQNVLVNLSTSEKKLSVKISSLPKGGYLVDPLLAQPGFVLYAKNRHDNKPTNRLYKISVDKLAQKNFNQAKLVERNLQDVFFFSYDSNIQRIFAATLDIDERIVDIKYRSLDSDDWIQIYQITNSNDQFIPIGFLNDNTLAVLSDKETDKIALYEFDIPSQTLGKVVYEHPKYDLVSAIVNNNQIQEVSFFENGILSSHFLNNGFNDIHAITKKAFPNKQVRIRAADSDESQFIIVTYGSDDRGSYYLLNKQANKFDLLTEVDPILSQYPLRPTNTISIESEPGLFIEAYLTMPATKTSNGTLLVMPHGGPVGVRDYNSFNNETQYFVSRGFAVLRVNFRGSDGFGKQFLNSGKAQFGKAIERDITAVVNHVSSQHKFTNKCAIGSSYGGYSSLMLAIMHPNEYQCVVGSYGVYDLPLLFNSDNYAPTEERRVSIEEIVGKETQQLIDYSPVYLASKVKAPVLLVAGKQDRVASFEHTLRMEYVLNRHNVNVESLHYDDTGHGQLTTYWRRHELAYIAGYLQRKLKLAPYYESADIDQITQEKLAKDMAMIADSFNFDDKVTNDTEKALDYYQTAANLGNARSANNIGQILLNKGKILKDNKVDSSQDNMQKKQASSHVKNGIEWLKKASESNYASASESIAKIYQDGEIVDRDLNQALEYYSIAAEQGANANVLIQMAKIHCLSNDKHRDIARCNELLAISELEKIPEKEQINSVTDKARRLLRDTIGEIYAKGEFNKSELQQLRARVEQEYSVKVLDIKFDEVEFGEVEYNVRHQRNELVSSEQQYESKNGPRLGLMFEVELQDKDKSDNVALIVKWINTDPQGNKKVLGSNFIWGGADSNRWGAYLSLKDKPESIGLLEAQLTDINNIVLLSKSVQLL